MPEPGPKRARSLAEPSRRERGRFVAAVGEAGGALPAGRGQEAA